MAELSLVEGRRKLVEGRRKLCRRRESGAHVHAVFVVTGDRWGTAGGDGGDTVSCELSTLVLPQETVPAFSSYAKKGFGPREGLAAAPHKPKSGE